jgi:hypothetical protein
MTPRDRASRSFFIHCFLVLAAVLLVSGCAGVPYRLEPASAARLDTARARSVVSQEKISIEVMASSYGSGLGLIGALIDSGVTKGRTSDAERRVAPLRDQTQDLDFRAKFWEQLGPAIQAVEWPSITDVQTATAWAPLPAADVKESHLLDLQTSFWLSPNSAVLRIQTTFSLHMKGSATPAAIGSVSYWSRDIGKAAEGKYKEDEEAVALWAADNCAAYRAAVDEGIAETVKMLRMALPYAGGRDVSKPGPAAEFKYDLTHGRGDFGLKSWRDTLRGAVLERTDDRLMLQVQPGPIFSIPMAEAEERKLP